MKAITIKHAGTGKIIYEGRFPAMRQAVESAISDGVSLAFADLRHANLSNARMDGAILDGATLEQANLLGANLSEASLRRTSLANAQLHSAVLCEAVLDAVNARGALFGATDIAGATVTRCLFDTLSALDLNFRDARLELNGFAAANDHICEFSQPPLHVKGLPFTLTCFDRSLLIGHHALTALPFGSSGSPLFDLIARYRPLVEAFVENLTPRSIALYNRDNSW